MVNILCTFNAIQIMTRFCYHRFILILGIWHLSQWSACNLLQQSSCNLTHFTTCSNFYLAWMNKTKILTCAHVSYVYVVTTNVNKCLLWRHFLCVHLFYFVVFFLLTRDGKQFTNKQTNNINWKMFVISAAKKKILFAKNVLIFVFSCI